MNVLIVFIVFNLQKKSDGDDVNGDEGSIDEEENINDDDGDANINVNDLREPIE